MACRRSGSHRRAPRAKARRTPALELATAQGAGQSGGLIMAGISYVFTITRVAKMIGEDEDWLHEISIEMDPEDGRLTVLGPGEEAITAFTRSGVDNLIELVEMYKANPNLLPRSTPPECPRRGPHRMLTIRPAEPPNQFNNF